MWGLFVVSPLMRAYAILAFICLAAACASERSRPDRDFVSVAEASLKVIEERRGPVTIVVPPEIDMTARIALESLRNVISPNAVPQSESFELPEGYFLLKTFRIVGNEAQIEGTLCPLPRSTTGMMGCGSLLKIPLHRVKGNWVQLGYQRTLC